MKAKEISKDNAICVECGYVMNIPKSYATLCYDCAIKRERREHENK